PLLAETRQSNKTMPGLNHILVNKVKEAERLRREAMTLPGQAMEGVVCIDCVGCPEVMDFDALALRFPNISLVGFFEFAELEFFAGFHRNSMSPKLIEWNGVGQGLSAASQFQVVPPSLATQISESLNEGFQCTRICD